GRGHWSSWSPVAPAQILVEVQRSVGCFLRTRRGRRHGDDFDPPDVNLDVVRLPCGAIRLLARDASALRKPRGDAAGAVCVRPRSERVICEASRLRRDRRFRRGVVTLAWRLVRWQYADGSRFGTAGEHGA